MASLSWYIGAVRRKWRYPNEQVISDGNIIEIIYEVLDEMVTELNLSSQEWYAPRFPLTVASGQDVYPITQVGDYGRGIFAYTQDLTIPSFSSRRVLITDEEPLYASYEGGDPGPSGTKHSVNMIAQYWDAGQWYLKFAPIPMAACDYIIVYSPNQVRPSAINEEAFRLKEFDNLITDMVAFKGLPLITWPEFEGLPPMQRQQCNITARNDIRSTLEVEIERGMIRFRRFRQSDRKNTDFRVKPYGRERWGRGRW